MSGEPVPSPTGNFLSVYKFLALLSKTYFYMSIYSFQPGWGTVKLWVCTLPCLPDAEFHLQGEFQLLWWCVEAQLSSVGSRILSYYYIKKSTKKKMHAPQTTGCEAGSPEPSLPVRQHVHGVGGLPSAPSGANLGICSVRQLRLWRRAMPGLEKPRAFVRRNLSSKWKCGVFLGVLI